MPGLCDPPNETIAMICNLAGPLNPLACEPSPITISREVANEVMSDEIAYPKSTALRDDDSEGWSYAELYSKLVVQLGLAHGNFEPLLYLTMKNDLIGVVNIFLNAALPRDDGAVSGAFYALLSKAARWGNLSVMRRLCNHFTAQPQAKSSVSLRGISMRLTHEAIISQNANVTQFLTIEQGIHPPSDHLDYLNKDTVKLCELKLQRASELLEHDGKFLGAPRIPQLLDEGEVVQEIPTDPVSKRLTTALSLLYDTDIWTKSERF